MQTRPRKLPVAYKNQTHLFTLFATFVSDQHSSLSKIKKKRNITNRHVASSVIICRANRKKSTTIQINTFYVQSSS